MAPIVGGRGPRSVVWRQHVELWEEFPPSDAGAEMRQQQLTTRNVVNVSLTTFTKSNW